MLTSLRASLAGNANIAYLAFFERSRYCRIKRILGENIDSLKMLSDRRRTKTGTEPWEYVIINAPLKERKRCNLRQQKSVDVIQIAAGVGILCRSPAR